jgi:hypothetical protein
MNKPLLIPGSLVEVAPAAEIFATLDARGESDGIPFMPEMLKHIGKQYRIAQCAIKLCHLDGTTLLPPGAFYLDQVRCDGSAHGGCQAECRLIWREEWLRPATPRSPRSGGDTTHEHLGQLVAANTTAAAVGGSEQPVWRCQATQIARAGKQVSWKKPGQYFREMACKNISLSHFARVLARVIVRRVGQKLRIIGELPVEPAGPNAKDGERLGLHPGDWVEIRSAEEIAQTLDSTRKHRGLIFVDEMVQHCGKRFRVRRRVDQIIDESTGRMLAFKKNECIALEGLVCTGDRATGSWFCRRELYPFWREAWLKRAAPQGGDGPQSVDPLS